MNTYLLYILVFVLIFFKDVFSQDYLWKKIETPTNKRLTKISYIDSLNIWVCGDSGTVIYTSNGGRTWQVQNPNTLSDIRDINFPNLNTGYLIYWQIETPSFGTVLMKTTDMGNTWNQLFFKENDKFFHSIKFKDSLNGWMIGENGYILRTNDGGIEWQQMNIILSPFSRLPVLDIDFYSPEFGIACGGYMDIAGVIWRTTDYGNNWRALIVGPEPIQRIKFIDSTKIFGLGGDYEYGSSTVVSYDSGKTFTYTSLDIFGIPPTMAFRTHSEIWSSLGIDPYFLKSIDTGNTFYLIETPDSIKIEDIVFFDSSNGMAVGRDGIIMKYSKNNFTKVENDAKKNIEKKLILNQNYPNPFNPTTYIEFELFNDANIELSVYNFLGERVAILLNSYLNSGKYKVKFNAERLPAGTYFYRLKKGNEIISKKMILMK